MHDVRDDNNMPCVLVVDDDRLTLLIAEAGLRKAGYRYMQAEQPQDALRMIASRPPDLVVLDISMPQMSGMEMARYLRSADIPFVFLTAHDEEEIVAQAVEAGAIGYLVKPVDISCIVSEVRSALERTAEWRRLLQS